MDRIHCDPVHLSPPPRHRHIQRISIRKEVRIGGNLVFSPRMRLLRRPLVDRFLAMTAMSGSHAAKGCYQDPDLLAQQGSMPPAHAICPECHRSSHTVVSYRTPQTIILQLAQIPLPFKEKFRIVIICITLELDWRYSYSSP
jgi:hypothetical protein